MIQTAVFHVYIDGIQAALDWLVNAELFLRDLTQTLCASKTYHLIYHLYNWLQFQALISEIDENIFQKIDDIKVAIEDNDRDAALDILEELKEKFDSNLTPPNLL